MNFKNLVPKDISLPKYFQNKREIPYQSPVGADNPTAKTIYKYTRDYIFVGEVKGVQNYARSIGVSPAAIWKGMKEGYCVKGYRYLSEKLPTVKINPTPNFQYPLL